MSEQAAPSKEEVLKFLNEQIEMKEVQLKLQALNADLAEARARELKALAFIGQMTNPQPEGRTHVLTQEDIDQNPELTEQGFKVGDEVYVSGEPVPQQDSAKQERSLKKKK
jgi:hypothetical protein